MKFIIDPKIFSDFANPKIGVIIASGIDNNGVNPEIASLLRTEETKIRSSFKAEELSLHPNIACWREAYKQFGSKPRDFRCSIEALLRVILRGDQVRDISKLVDLYNFISIKYVLPVGGEDLSKIKGDLNLCFADGTEDYTPLHGEENDSPKKGEVIYKDDLGVLCRRWNWREGERTKITQDTKDAVLVIEALDPVTKEDLEKACNEFAELIEKYCGGETQVNILDKNSQNFHLTFSFNLS